MSATKEEAVFSKDESSLEIENVKVTVPPPPSWEAIIDSFSAQETKKLIFKIDMRLVLPLGFMYCVSLMDRNNLGNAAIVGMSRDLELVGNRYSLIVMLFFITYVGIQPIAVPLVRKVGPLAFIPTICLLWGLVTIGFGFVEHWYQLLPLRVLLGALEAGYLPSCVYLMSTWYVRYELQLRNALFYATGILATAFSGILSYGFAQMSGLGRGASWMGEHHGPTKQDPNAAVSTGPGLAGWRWIFIMQGILTIAVAIIGYIFVVDFPELTMKHRYWVPFLTQREVDFMVARVEKDRQDVVAEP